MRTRDINSDRILCEKVWKDFCPEPGNLHMEKRVFPFWRKVTKTIKLQYLLEAREHNMDINEYVDWLKQQAHIKSKYDCLYSCIEGEKSIDEKAKELAKKLEEA